MGEIADGLINGDFDFYTGEYLGKGYGIPRTKNKSLAWEKKVNRPKQKIPEGSKHKYYSGAKGEFVQNRMSAGRTKNQAHRDWKKSAEKKKWDDLNKEAGY